jgi:hypothetical protein
MISRSAISAAPRVVTSATNGRLRPPAPELSWRTRRETKLTRTLGLPTFSNAFRQSSAFTIIFVPNRARYNSGCRGGCNRKKRLCRVVFETGQVNAGGRGSGFGTQRWNWVGSAGATQSWQPSQPQPMNACPSASGPTAALAKRSNRAKVESFLRSNCPHSLRENKMRTALARRIRRSANSIDGGPPITCSRQRGFRSPDAHPDRFEVGRLRPAYREIRRLRNVMSLPDAPA